MSVKRLRCVGMIESMTTYLILIRGINVGGKNKLPMRGLREHLEKLGFINVSTYINTGNVILDSDESANQVRQTIEESLPKSFKLDSEILKVRVLTHKELADIVADKPRGFGEQPDRYHSDAIFLMDLDIDETMAIFSPREGVDKVWPGTDVVYSQRLSAERTKSRLSKIMASPAYKSMTIRSWQTTVKLLELLEARP